jgi:hypothetical protein
VLQAGSIRAAPPPADALPVSRYPTVKATETWTRAKVNVFNMIAPTRNGLRSHLRGASQKNKMNCFKLGDGERLSIDPQGTARLARAPFRGVATGGWARLMSGARVQATELGQQAEPLRR